MTKRKDKGNAIHSQFIFNREAWLRRWEEKEKDVKWKEY